MPRYPYRQIGVKLNRQARLDQNKNLVDIAADIGEQDTKNKAVNARIDAQLTGVEQPSEVVDARVDAHGKIYNVIKSRIDADQQTSESGINENVDDIYNKTKQISVPSTYSGPMFAWIDDDVSDAFLTNLKPIMDQFNFKVGLGCVTDWVGQSGRLTKDQLLSLQSDGNEILSHSKTHDSDLWYTGKIGAADESALSNELSESQKWLRDNGFKGWDIFVYPGGDYTSDEASKAKRLVKNYYRYGINSVGNFANFPIDNMMIPRFRPQKGQTFADVQPIIDDAIAKNAGVIIISHSGITDYWDTSLMTAVAQYLADSSVPIVTPHELLMRKGNALSIGDATKKTSDKLIVDSAGHVTLPFKILDGIGSDNGFGFTNPVTDFPEFCISICLLRNAADALTGNGGLLITYYFWIGSYFNRQDFFANGGRKYSRNWNEGTQSWDDFTYKSKFQSYPSVIQDPMTIDDSIKNYRYLDKTVRHVSPEFDNIFGLGGILETYHGDPYYSYQEFTATNGRIVHRTWNGPDDNGYWNRWIELTSYIVRPNNYHTVTDAITEFNVGQVEETCITTDGQAGFPENLPGILKTHRYEDDVYSYQTYQIRGSNKIYRRYCDSNNNYAWTDFEKITAV